MGNDPYTVLGVARDATDKQIRSAFLKLAKTSHPLDRDQVKAATAWDRLAMIDQVYARNLPSREGWRRVGF